MDLLHAIKEHTLNYQEYKYSMSIISDAFPNLLRTRQKDYRNLQKYAKRFKTAKDIFQSHLGGPLTIPKVVHDHPDFHDDNEAENLSIVEEVYQQFQIMIHKV